MTGSPAFDAWVDEARAVTVEQALAKRHTTLKRVGASEQAGPCPSCGGRDRFSINTAKNVFHCRGSGAGGDVIALVQYLYGCDFRVACEILTGRPPPDRAGGETAEARAARERAQDERRAQAARQAEAREADENGFREREIKRCKALWADGVPLAGTPAEAYLALRGLTPPPDVLLRCALDHPYYEYLPNGQGAKAWAVVHRGPALLAPIYGRDRRFSGLHATWIDLGRPKGKVELFHPGTGELLPAKKVRGSARGGFIPLLHRPGATGMYLGEGNETVLSVWQGLHACGDPRARAASFWSGYRLGNIGGKATATVAHPRAVTVDRLGRRRPRRVPGPVPDFAHPSIPMPGSLRWLTLLGDGDSDRPLTRNALLRGALRARRQVPECDTRESWAPDGVDFNDVLMGAAA